MLFGFISFFTIGSKTRQNLVFSLLITYICEFQLSKQNNNSFETCYYFFSNSNFFESLQTKIKKLDEKKNCHKKIF